MPLFSLGPWPTDLNGGQQAKKAHAQGMGF